MTIACHSLITYRAEGGPNDGEQFAALLKHPEHLQAFDDDLLRSELKDCGGTMYCVSQLPPNFVPEIWNEYGEKVDLQIVDLTNDQ